MHLKPQLSSFFPSYTSTSSSRLLWLFMTWQPVLGGGFMVDIRSIPSSISRFKKKRTKQNKTYLSI